MGAKAGATGGRSLSVATINDPDRTRLGSLRGLVKGTTASGAGVTEHGQKGRDILRADNSRLISIDGQVPGTCTRAPAMPCKTFGIPTAPIRGTVAGAHATDRVVRAGPVPVTGQQVSPRMAARRRGARDGYDAVTDLVGEGSRPSTEAAPGPSDRHDPEPR